MWLPMQQGEELQLKRVLLVNRQVRVSAFERERESE